MTPFRLLTWNVLAPEYSAPGFGDTDFYADVRPFVPWEVRRDRLVARMRAFSPTIACLQEVSPEPWEELQQAFAPEFTGEWLQKRLPRQRDGVATLVRTASVDVRRTERLSFHDGTGFGALVQHLVVDGRELVVANAHLKWSKDDTTQIAQLREVLDTLDALPKVPQVFCGDFNFDVRAHPVWSELSERGFACAYESRANTWSANSSSLRVDEILTSPGLVTLEVVPLRVIDASTPLPDALDPSDHLPMLAELAFV